MPAASVAVVGDTFQCPLPCTVEDAVSLAAQKTQLGSWENVLLSCGTQKLKPGDTLEAVEYSLTSYDAFGNSAIRIRKTECRGITLPQLQAIVSFITSHAHLWVETHSESPNFGQPLEAQVLNLYHACNWIITPATRRFECSFVELLATRPEDQWPRWFVSHAWQEAVCRFVACLRQHASLRNASGCAYWICAYANNQHKLQEPPGRWLFIAHVITDGLAAAEERQMPLLGFLAKSLREANFPTLLAQKGLGVDIAQANASKADDRTRILNSVRRPQARTKELADVAPLQDTNYSAVTLGLDRNQALAAHFALASWFGFVAQGHDTSDLLDALAADSSRQMVELSLVELGSWEPLAKLQLEELVLQVNSCNVSIEARQYACVKELKSAQRGLDLRLRIEGVAEWSWSRSWWRCQMESIQEVEMVGSKAVDVDIDNDLEGIDIDCGSGRAPF
eukprot:s3126_g1.t2